MALASGGVYAATTVMSSNISYSNTNSGLSSTDVQGAIDELYEKVGNKFVKAYVYNESGANKCITGLEDTCKRTTCYKTKIANSYPAGTIIFYRVNDLRIEPFHVIFDHGNTITLQSQKTIAYSSWGGPSNTSGPNNILSISFTGSLEQITKDWTNVNDQTYTLGTTSFSGKGAYTGCNENLNCTTNIYTSKNIISKARMITVQEAVSLGCTANINSCPLYLRPPARGHYYWTMNAPISVSSRAFFLVYDGNIISDYAGESISNKFDVRAVVNISK